MGAARHAGQRFGARHDWYRNPETGVYQPVPRHREIRERLAKHILAQLGCRLWRGREKPCAQSSQDRRSRKKHALRAAVRRF